MEVYSTRDTQSQELNKTHFPNVSLLILKRITKLQITDKYNAQTFMNTQSTKY